MKTSMLIALMTEGFKLVSVRFRGENGPSRKLYHYKHCGDIAVGDMVVVESPHDGFVIVDVEEVDENPVLDMDAGFSYKWTVQRIDTTEYYKHRDREMGLTKHLRRLRNRAAAEQSLQEMRQLLEGTEAAKEFEALVDSLDVSRSRTPQITPPQPPQAPSPQAPPVAPYPQAPTAQRVDAPDNGTDKEDFWFDYEGNRYHLMLWQQGPGDKFAGQWYYRFHGDKITEGRGYFYSRDRAIEMAKHDITTNRRKGLK